MGVSMLCTAVAHASGDHGAACPEQPPSPAFTAVMFPLLGRWWCSGANGTAAKPALPCLPQLASW